MRMDQKIKKCFRARGAAPGPPEHILILCVCQTLRDLTVMYAHQGPAAGWASMVMRPERMGEVARVCGCTGIWGRRK